MCIPNGIKFGLWEFSNKNKTGCMSKRAILLPLKDGSQEKINSSLGYISLFWWNLRVRVWVRPEDSGLTILTAVRLDRVKAGTLHGNDPKWTAMDFLLLCLLLILWGDLWKFSLFPTDLGFLGRLLFVHGYYCFQNLLLLYYLLFPSSLWGYTFKKSPCHSFQGVTQRTKLNVFRWFVILTQNSHSIFHMVPITQKVLLRRRGGLVG